MWHKFADFGNKACSTNISMNKLFDCTIFVSMEQDVVAEAISSPILGNKVPSTNVSQPELDKFFHLLFHFCIRRTRRRSRDYMFTDSWK